MRFSLAVKTIHNSSYAITLLFVLLLLPLVSYANEPYIFNTHLPPQLQDKIIQSIYRDKNGQLWIGTNDNLFKFDGNTVISYSPSANGKNWIPDGNITSISEDASGRILVGTVEGGLLVWSELLQKFKVFDIFSHNQPELIRDIRVTDNGAIWLTAGDEIYLINPGGGLVKTWTHDNDDNSPKHGYYSILRAERDHIFIGGRNGIVRVDSVGNDPKKIGFSFPDHHGEFTVTALEQLNDSKILLGTDTGRLAILDTTIGKIVASRQIEKAQPKYVSHIKRYRSQFIVATDDGVYLTELDLSELREITNLGIGLRSKNIFSMLAEDDLFWLGTFRGIQLLFFGQFELVSPKIKGRNVDINKLTTTPDGGVWIATYDGLYHRSPNNNVIRVGFDADPEGLEGPVDPRISALAVLENRLWIGSFNGKVQTYDLRTGKFDTVPILAGKNVEVPDIQVHNRLREVWIATNRNGLFSIRDGIIRSFLDDGGLDMKTVLRVIPTRSGKVFALNLQEISYFDRELNLFRPLIFDFGVDGKPVRISAIAEAESGDLVFGTMHYGIFLWRKSDQKANRMELIPLGKQIDYRQQAIYEVFFDARGNLWALTSVDVAKYGPDGELIRRFTTSDGFHGQQFSWGNSHQAQDGTLYMSGEDGYIKFHPDDIELDLTPPNTILSSIHFPDKSYVNILPPQEEKTVEISHYDHFVTFEFSVDDFIGYQENQFRYKLEGFDPKWRDIGFRNSATYTNLPAGNYTLRAVGANAAGIWDDTGLALPVKVFPPPWRSWWAHMLYTLAGLLAFWAAHRTYQSYLIERKIAVLAQEMDDTAEQAEDEMQEQLEFQDELLQTAYTHKVDTLGLVKAALGVTAAEASELVGSQSGSSRSSQRVLSALTLMESCMFYGAGGPSGDVRKFSELALADLLESSPTDADTVITINEISGALIPAPVCSVLAVVLYELLDNCVQHAFSPESHANYIRLQITESREVDTGAYVYELYVGDSGAGLPPDLFVHPTHGSGAATLLALLAEFGGEARVTEGSDSAVVIRIVDERIEPYA